MTWIRCSDRMPMGEDVEVRDMHDPDEVYTFKCANVETLRRAALRPDWIDCAEWRPLDEAPLHDEGEPSTRHDETSGVNDEETLRAALRRYGFEPQLSMLTEECGELVAAVNRWRRGREGAFPSLLEEIADVEILIDQMRLVYGAEIDAARARKLARLRERLGR